MELDPDVRLMNVPMSIKIEADDCNDESETRRLAIQIDQLKNPKCPTIFVMKKNKLVSKSISCL